MNIQQRHAWDVSPKEAIEIQKQLAPELVDHPLNLNRIQKIAGVDVSVSDNVSRAAVVILTYPKMELIETVRAEQPTPFPYIAGLLTFREGPVLVDAFAKLQNEPDAFIFDGMGRIHPRRMGIAAHMGLWLNRPTIGVGKTHFIGEYDAPGILKGSYSLIHHKGDTIGAVLRTRDRVKPVYISAGHLSDLDSALHLTLSCTPKYKLPRPIRLAHNAAGQS